MFRDVANEAVSPAGSRTGRNVVAVIGIDQYRRWPRLNNAVNDARGVLKVFARLGFEQVVEPLYDEAATAEALRGLVMDDLAKLGRNDSLVLFFAGHGHTVTRTYDEGDSVKTGYIIPADGEAPGGSPARWLRLDGWLSDVARLPAKHILVFLDACHSGIALGSLIKWRDAQQRGEPLEVLSRRRSRRVITSALDDQRAMDGGPVPGHSLFTGCLIEGLGGALASHGERVTGSQLGLYLQQRVATYPSSAQTPDFGALEEDKRGELVIEIVTEQPEGPAEAPPSHDGPGARFTRSLAVVIGIDTHGDGIAPLRSAVADAKAVAEALRRDHGFETRCVLGGEARLPRLLALLREELPAAVGPDDRLLLYFAGHGIALDGDGPAGYLVPAGARRSERDGFLPIGVLLDELARLPVRHALVILDCCFAGAFRWRSHGSPEPVAAKLYRERYERYVEHAAWQVLASVSSDPLALDLLENDRGDGTSSPFARALLEGLAGGADHTQDHVITAGELVKFVRERVAPAAELGGRRVPQLVSLGRHDGGQFLFQVPNRRVELAAAPPLGEQRPYRGLESFRREDHASFFGREAIAARLVDAVIAQPLTVVVGPAGCGKSSLVHAGLVPALRARGWSVLATQRPGRSPLAVLEVLDQELRAGSELGATQPGASSRRTRQPRLVIIDQLEELVTHRPAPRDRAAFLEGLASALKESALLHVVVVVGAEAEPQLGDGALAPWWKPGRFAVPEPTRDELREMIEKPATAAVLYFDPPRLVERLLDDALQAPSPLPLLAFVLAELYRTCAARGEAGERMLRETDYEAMGGAEALTWRAVGLHDELVAEDAAFAITIRNVLLRMVTVAGGELAGCRVASSELVYDSPAENRRVDEVLRRFHRARLISIGTEAIGTERTSRYAEPAHGEVVRRWRSVSRWLEDADTPPGTHALLGALAGAVRAWRAHDQAEARLWSDPRVELIERLARERPFLLNAHEALFLRRSAERRRGRRARLAERLIGQRRLLARSYQETGRRFVLDGRGHEALPYLVAARRAGAAGAPLRVLFHAASRALPALLLEHRGGVRRAAWSPDGARIVTASEDHTARVWDAATGRPLSPPLAHRGVVWSAVFSPDGARVATASEDRTARIWDAATGRPLSPPLEHQGGVWSVAFSPPGDRVVTTSHDQTARVWDVATGKPLSAPLQHQGAVGSAAFSPHGRRVVTASYDQTARVWDAATGKPLCPPLVHQGWVMSAAFSPGGSRVVTASLDKTARVWDAATGTPLSPPLVHQGTVWSAAFSPDGTRVLTASLDNKARVWDAATGKLLSPPLAHQREVRSAAFSPHGTRVVTASRDGTAQIWDAATGKPLSIPLVHQDYVVGAAFSPDGTRVLTASLDGSARVWATLPGLPPFRPLAHQAEIRGAAFSPDGTCVVTASRDRTARVWDAVTGKPLSPSLAHQDEVNGAALTRDGTRAVTASRDRTARVWDAVTGRPVTAPLAHQDEVTGAAFSPDGARVVTASKDGTARVWSAATGEPLTPPLAHHGGVSQAAFSPDGTRVITAGRDHTARIWDAATGKPLSPPLAHEGDVVSAAFSPDGLRAVTASEDKAARVWSAATGEPLTPPLVHGGGVAGAAFDARGLRVVTASKDGTARLWSAATGELLVPPLQHPGPVGSAAFSPDGSLVVTASSDASLRVWEAATGKALARPIAHPGPVEAAALGPGGRRVVTAGGDKTAWLSELPLDEGTLGAWSAIVERCPYVLIDGVLVLRSRVPQPVGPR